MLAGRICEKLEAWEAETVFCTMFSFRVCGDDFCQGQQQAHRRATFDFAVGQAEMLTSLLEDCGADREKLRWRGGEGRAGGRKHGKHGSSNDDGDNSAAAGETEAAAAGTGGKGEL